VSTTTQDKSPGGSYYSGASVTDPTVAALQAQLDSIRGMGSYDYDAAMAKMQGMYDSAMAAAMARQRAAGEMAAQAVYGQKPILEQGLQDTSRQNWIMYNQGKKALPQQMASRGLGGGLTESSMVGLNTNYGENNNQARMQFDRNIAEMEMEAARQRALAEGNAAADASGFAQGMISSQADMMMAQAAAEQERQRQIADLDLQIRLAQLNGQSSAVRRSSSSGGSGGNAFDTAYGNGGANATVTQPSMADVIKSMMNSALGPVTGKDDYYSNYGNYRG
jgi:hypothetical protein